MTPIFSIVLPVYNEHENIPELYRRLNLVSKQLGHTTEMIFINDGSSDSTLKIVAALSKKDRRVRLINFSRNFGHQVAVSAGLDHSRGKYIAILDSDLQDPPEVLPKFFAKLKQGYNVVYAIRRDRKESWWLKAAYAGFYKLLSVAANINIPLDSGDFCVMDQKALHCMRQLPERNRFVRGLRSWIGLKQIGLEYKRAARFAGTTKYSLRKLFRLAFDGIFSFSFVPLQLLTFFGFQFFTLSIVFSLLIVYVRLFTDFFVPGFATTIILILFTSGLNMLSLGLVGEYVGRIYDEVKQRPQYIIESKIGFNN
ncbi:glycosyl transferase [Candidatus Amesbacteria bacterium RIFOXYB1_FULL_44_23]|uniref:Glycosyl transferase n=1 Tax=Candidatus Amesbacteria bacterium RIFOXYB1_FULL_44_23 TaxID=1797263 RepID=A0A1F4ZRQ2_9BACT|nr:MAG: glycosyl transferase [Candidatus Amesbacteria bacterium RIFOXYB1_FULL_44_23]